MFTTVINKMLFYFYKYHSSPMKTSVSMAYICVLKGLGQNHMYNFHYKNKTTDIYRYSEVANILTLQNYTSIRNLSQICSLYTL